MKDFPKLMEEKEIGTIVLFKKSCEGTVVLQEYPVTENTLPLGHYSNEWNMKNFKDTEYKMRVFNAEDPNTVNHLEQEEQQKLISLAMKEYKNKDLTYRKIEVIKRVRELSLEVTSNRKRLSLKSAKELSEDLFTFY